MFVYMMMFVDGFVKTVFAMSDFFWVSNEGFGALSAGYSKRIVY
jgi:hypothetical protein